MTFLGPVNRHSQISAVTTAYMFQGNFASTRTGPGTGREAEFFMGGVGVFKSEHIAHQTPHKARAGGLTQLYPVSDNNTLPGSALQASLFYYGNLFTSPERIEIGLNHMHRPVDDQYRILVSGDNLVDHAIFTDYAPISTGSSDILAKFGMIGNVGNLHKLSRLYRLEITGNDQIRRDQLIYIVTGFITKIT